MKKTLFIIFLGIFFFLSFFTKSSVSAVTYMPAICDAAFTDSQGENYSADDWCTDCPDGPYNFCNGGMQYHFGCVSDGIFGMYCSCDHNSAWYEDCSGNCTNWNCTKGSSCSGGSCSATVQTCPTGQIKPHKECIVSGTEMQCASLNTCGVNQCTTPANCAAAPQTCSQKSGTCCSGTQTCSSGKISGASDCAECCGSASSCTGGCPTGQVKPHKQCIVSGTEMQCASLNTCGVNQCTTPANCVAAPQTCEFKEGKCCPSGKYCSTGKISGATDCVECCPSLTNCVSGCAFSCEDSDALTGGQSQVWDVKGTCKEGNSCTGLTPKGTDSCSTDGKTLTEWYRDGTTCKSIIHDCSPGTCSDGRCVTAVPPPQKCGNPPGQLDPGEQCDGTNLNNKTCQSLGFTGGTLKCKSDCIFDTSVCTGAVPLPPTCPSLDGLTASGITISGFAWDEEAKKTGQCQFKWNGKVIPGFPSMASHITIPYEWMVAAGFPSKLTADNPSEVRDVLDKWYQISFINNRLRYRVKYDTDHPKLGEILSILSSPTGGICEGSGVCDLIKKLISEEPLRALDLKLVMHSYNELKLHRAMVECVLAGRCPPYTYGSWGYLLLGKCPLWKGADAKPEDCYWPEEVQF